MENTDVTKYTFLLPAWKTRFLAEALSSIKNQTYTDFKVIVSDDCSPEDVKGTYDAVVGDDSRFTYRRNEENIGGKSLVAHWNLLVDMCDTEFLIMASDDDVYDERFLEEIDRLQVKYPDVDLLHARAKVINSDGDVVQEDPLYKEYSSQIEFWTNIGLLFHVECVANYCYRTNTLKGVGGFVDFPLAWTSDTMTNNIMSKNGCATTKDILFSFRRSGDNISDNSKYDILVSIKKITASLYFGIRLGEEINYLKYTDNLLNRTIAEKAIELQRSVCAAQLLTYCPAIPLLQLIKFFKKFKQHKLCTNSQIRLALKKWLYYKIKGK